MCPTFYICPGPPLSSQWPWVCVYIDDMLVTGKDIEEHLRNLGEVLRRLEEAGMKVKHEKCLFLLSEVEYLGHVISSTGL